MAGAAGIEGRRMTDVTNITVERNPNSAECFIEFARPSEVNGIKYTGMRVSITRLQAAALRHLLDEYLRATA